MDPQKQKQYNTVKTVKFILLIIVILVAIVVGYFIYALMTTEWFSSND